MKQLMVGLLAIIFAVIVNTAYGSDAGCDARFESCNTDNGHVDGSLNTNSGNQNSNNSNTGNTNGYTNSHNTEHNGNIYSSGGGSQVINADPATTSHTSTNTQRVISNQVAPVNTSNLTTSGADTCLGSTTAGLSVPGFSGSHGTTVVDKNCETIKNVKLLASLGLKDAAVCLMYQQSPGAAAAIVEAYPAIADLCDPERKAKKAAEAASQQAIEAAKQAEAERLATLAKYEAVGLEPPAHLLEPIEIPTAQVEIEEEEKDYWYNVDGKKCYWGTVPFTNIKTKVCS